MGCFFGCFRVKYDSRPHAHLVSDAVASKKRDALISGNKLGSLFLSEEKEFSPSEDTKCRTLGSALLRGDGEVRELRDEAKFLKACGTLLETPTELRKASERVKDSPTCDGESKSSRLHSWLPSPVKKLHWEEQPDQASTSPPKLCENVGGELGSPEHKPSCCRSKGDMVEKNCIKDGYKFESPDAEITNPEHAIDHDKLPSVTPEALAVNIQSRNKSVRFECDKSLKQSDVPGGYKGSNHSPYPTPLRLTDEMQTPGTIYAVSLDNHANGKNARIRSQYVYSVLNPVENFSQWRVLKEDDSNTCQQSGQPRESFEKSGHATPQCTSSSFSCNSEMLHEGAAMVSKDLKVDASLAHWLKPSSPKNDRNQNSGAGSKSSGKSPKMSDEDRPILGMVAAHWNDDELSHVSPKWWDGNGIPNSTTKYKEDQRVSWHATPFEERLEKALSEESNVYQRKLSSGRPIIFEENEETDTAVSRLHTSPQPESLVSF